MNRALKKDCLTGSSATLPRAKHLVTTLAMFPHREEVSREVEVVDEDKWRWEEGDLVKQGVGGEKKTEETEEGGLAPKPRK